MPAFRTIVRSRGLDGGIFCALPCDQPVVNCAIFPRHGAGAEAFLETRTDRRAEQTAETSNGLRSLLRRIDHKAGQAVLQHLRYRTLAERDHRRAASHG